MKVANLGLLLALTLPLLLSCSKSERYPFPSTEETGSAKAGDLVLRAGTYRIKEEPRGADFGTLTVLEDRNKPEDGRIHLPVVRLRATGKNPAEPVFLLAGGPGQSNIWKSPPDWLLADHDIVMVGYRGMDGSVVLNSPEVAKALKTKEDPFSRENIQRLAKAFYKAFQRLKGEGIQVDRYTMVDVVDDMEDARRALGYEKIDLFSRSYGTRVAYIYGQRYPRSLHRSLMIGVNPPGHFVWEPGMVDSQLEYYAALWKKDPNAASRAPDLIKTIKDVLGSLPRKWLLFTVDPDKVKFAAFMFLYHTGTAAQVFDAFVAAEKGDYSGLAFFSVMFDRAIAKSVNWGDNAAKAFSADFDPTRDYETEMTPPGSVLGSPMSKLWAVTKYGGFPIRPIPVEYRELQYSDVETLMVNGSIDFATPAAYAKNELLPYLRNGKLVVLAEMGHCDDVLNLQPEAFRHLAGAFYLKGVVDASRFRYEPMNFAPSQSLPRMAKGFVRRLAFMGGGAVVVLILVVVGIVSFVKRRKRLLTCISSQRGTTNRR